MVDVTVIRNRDNKSNGSVRRIKKELDDAGIEYEYVIISAGDSMGPMAIRKESTGEIFHPVTGDINWWRVVIPKKHRELQRKALLERLYALEAEGVIGEGDVENQTNPGLHGQDKNQAHDS